MIPAKMFDGDLWVLAADATKMAENAYKKGQADEREACAQVCDVLADDYGKAGLPMTYQALAATSKEIRARGNT